MSASGSVFVLTENYFALFLAALIGTINVTGSETGAFLSIEQAMLPQTVTDSKKRNTNFALYNLVGMLAMSAGILVSSLASYFEQYGLNQVESIKSLFVFYSILGNWCHVHLLYAYEGNRSEEKWTKTTQDEPFTKIKEYYYKTIWSFRH